MTRLSFGDVRVRLGRQQAVDGVSFTIGEGEVVGLVGPNGAGKTTLLRAALALVPSTGRVAYDGTPIAALPASERARRAAYLAQEREIAWPVEVRTVVALGRAPHRSAAQPLTPHDNAVIDAAMERMDVARFAARRATELSGGERARVLIARALAQEAPLLLADEPAAGLDPAHQIAVMQSFGRLAAEGGSVIASLHELNLAARWCSRIVMMACGQVVADGTPAEVFTPERLARIYGIEARVEDAGGRPLIQQLGLVP